MYTYYQSEFHRLKKSEPFLFILPDSNSALLMKDKSIGQWKTKQLTIITGSSLDNMSLYD